MAHHSTFDEYELYESARRFVFLPRTCSRSPHPPICNFDNVLVLDRTSGAFKEYKVPEEKREEIFNGMESMTRIFGVVGVVSLLSGQYLIVVLRREYIGEVRGNEIYRLKEIQCIPINQRTLTDEQRERESAYLAMITKVLCEEDSFYFSYTNNLCVDFQDTFTDNATPFAAKHFFWNRHFSKSLHEAGLDKFILPMIRGLVELTDATIADKTFRFGLIARTSCKRAGTRYNCRGADTDGNVANYAEVEHFIDYDGVFTSFRQIRGSIPFQWTQFAENLKYTPEIKFDTSREKFKTHQETILKHFSDVNKSFPGPAVCINLCKKKEEHQERRLSDMYEKLVNSVQFEQKYVKYIHFDLHHECKNLDFTKLDELIDSLAPNFEDISYFMQRYAPSEAEGTDVQLLSFDDEENRPQFRPEVMQRQRGIFRVNCVDCCDRTNVVKTYISRCVFLKQLYDLGIVRRRGTSLIAYPQLERTFNHFWSENGDRISTLYTGTGALMGDYTRTGQRSVKGLMNDGLNSVTRYVKNNFIDEVRQRSMNLVLGKLDLESAEEQKAMKDSLFGVTA